MNKLEQAVIAALDRSCEAADAAMDADVSTGAAMKAAFGTPGTKAADEKFAAFRKAHLQVSGDLGINEIMKANKGKAFADLDADGKQARRNRAASSTWNNLRPDSARSKAKAGKAKAKAKAKGGKITARPALAQLADSPAELAKALKAFANRVQGQKDSPFADQLGLVAALQVCADKAKPMTKSQRLGTKSRTK
jgi:hypothetical protein